MTENERGGLLIWEVLYWSVEQLCTLSLQAGKVQLTPMPAFQFTRYFENDVLPRRPYLTREMCIRVVEHPVRSEPQEHNRFRFWAAVSELGDRFLPVVTLDDKLTIHNAFPDRRFRP